LDFLKFNQQNPLLSDKNLIKMAMSASQGMEYLSSNHIVHRDLASRNLLVKKQENEFCIKVSDFGLSKICAFNTEQISGAIPWKWTAIEGIKRRKFSTKSDVWSFGVVLWEMWTHGEDPYFGMKHDEATERIEGGYRLESPLNCPIGVYELMKKCWLFEPEDRPSFDKLYYDLQNLLNGPVNPLARSEFFENDHDASKTYDHDPKVNEALIPEYQNDKYKLHDSGEKDQ